MREETKMLVAFYGIEDGLDWLNFPITKPKELQFHHIKKKANGGTMEFSNGAILTPTAHRFLHIIEKYDIEIYNAITKMFKIYVMQKNAPTNEQRIIVYKLLKEFYKRHENTKTKKGKLILKERYIIGKNMI